MGFLISLPQPLSPPSNTLSNMMTTTTTGAGNSKCYSSTGDNEETDFMQELRMRVEEVASNDSRLPLIVIDSMLPRQILSINIVDTPNNPLMNLVRERIVSETPYVGVLGISRLKSGQTANLRSGVEAELRIVNSKVEGEGAGGHGKVRLEMTGGRRFEIDGDVVEVEGGWTEAQVRFLDDNVQGGNPVSSANAISIAREFTSPNMSMGCAGSSLVERWIKLAKDVEREPGQIDELLATLGEMPSAEEPSDCAFWIGALINPLPAMGVAMEIRPALLTAATDEERVGVALKGLTTSIRHMDGSAPMW